MKITICTISNNKIPPQVKPKILVPFACRPFLQSCSTKRHESDDGVAPGESQKTRQQSHLKFPLSFFQTGCWATICRPLDFAATVCRPLHFAANERETLNDAAESIAQRILVEIDRCNKIYLGTYLGGLR